MSIDGFLTETDSQLASITRKTPGLFSLIISGGINCTSGQSFLDHPVLVHDAAQRC